MDQPSTEIPSPAAAASAASVRKPGLNLELPPDPPPNPGKTEIPILLRLLLILSLLILLMSAWAEMLRLNAMAPPRAAVVGPDDQLILPGERVSFITLNLSVDQVEHRLGQGKIRPTEHAVLYHFPELNLTCGVEQGRVTSILVHSAMFQTRTGLTVGTDVEKVIRTFGTLYEYDKTSIGAGSRIPTRSTPALPPLPSAALTPPAGATGATSQANSTLVLTPTPVPVETRNPRVQEDAYTLHYWEKGVHFNVRGNRVDSILITAAVGS